MTIRELITNAANEVHSQNLMPDRAVDLRRELSAVYGNVLDVIQKTELAYKKVLLQELDKQKSAAKANIVAETLKEYQDFVEAKNNEKMLLKMMSSLNTFIKSKEEEYKSSRYQ